MSVGDRLTAAVGAVKAAVLRVRERNRTIRLAFRYPDHKQRAADPHYWRFEARRKELAESPEWYCHDCGREPPVVRLELHHRVPYALANGVDWERLACELGRPDFTEEQFWHYFHAVQVEPLCVRCHDLRHAVPEPVWRAMKVWSHTIPQPVRIRRRRK